MTTKGVNMKTIKIEPQTHKRLNKLKSELEVKNFSSLIDSLIYFYCQEHSIQFDNWNNETK